MGKTRDLFKKIRDSKGTFHSRMSTIKDRNGKDLTEAEKLRSVKNTEKDVNDWDNHVWLVPHLETSWSVKSRGL